MSKPVRTWTAAEDLLRAGTPASEIRCVGCDAPWDGLWLRTEPCCPTCRDLAGRGVWLWGDLAFGPEPKTASPSLPAPSTERLPAA